MSAKKNQSQRRTPKPKTPRSFDRTDLLKIVQAGVERFILGDAAIGDFQKAIRLAAHKGKIYSHPLSRMAFRTIVRAAVRERKRRMGDPSEKSITKKRKRNNTTTTNRDH